MGFLNQHTYCWEEHLPAEHCELMVQKPWFPVDFPVNQSNDSMIFLSKKCARSHFTVIVHIVISTGILGIPSKLGNQEILRHFESTVFICF